MILSSLELNKFMIHELQPQGILKMIFESSNPREREKNLNWGWQGNERIQLIKH